MCFVRSVILFMYMYMYVCIQYTSAVFMIIKLSSRYNMYGWYSSQGTIVANLHSLFFLGVDVDEHDLNRVFTARKKKNNSYTGFKPATILFVLLPIALACYMYMHVHG